MKLARIVRLPVNAVRGANELVRLMMNPAEVERVFAFADIVVGERGTEEFAKQISQLEDGPRFLAGRRRMPKTSIEELETLPAGSLGFEFARFLRENKLDPKTLPVKSAETDGQYVRARIYETHDIHHVVTGFSTQPIGEAGVLAFYLAQLPARVASMIVGAAFLRVGFASDAARVPFGRSIELGLRLGRTMKPIVLFPFEDHWETPVADVQRMLGIDPAIYEEIRTHARGDFTV